MLLTLLFLGLAALVYSLLLFLKVELPGNWVALFSVGALLTLVSGFLLVFDDTSKAKTPKELCDDRGGELIADSCVVAVIRNNG